MNMKPIQSPSSNSTPRYNLAINPPYQINYRAKRAGKHITATKRRITFQFGFSSAENIAAGRTEADCRGEEHEVVLIWSHITGKRQLYMDGREFHHSKAARGNTRFEHSWSITGNHVLKIIANGTPPMGEAARAMHRQFDLELDGMSFFSFCKIYELGTTASAGSAATGGAALSRRERNDDYAAAALPALTYSYRGAAYDTRDDNDYEEEDVQESPMPVVTVLPPVVVDLFDSQPSMSFPVASNLPLLTSSSTNSSSYAYDEFTPTASTCEKSFDSISYDIMSAYNNSNNSSLDTSFGSTVNAVPQPQPTVTADNTPTNCRALVPMNEENIDPVSKSMMNLVNLDDITATPQVQQQLLAPIPSSSYQTNRANQQSNNCGLIGRAPTLAEIRGSSQSPSTIPVQREVMKVHHNPSYPAAAQQGYYQAQQQPQSSYQGYQSAVAAPSYGYSAPPSHQYYAAPPTMGYAPAY